MMRTYEELITLPTYSERFKYCDLTGIVGEETFGYFRWLNQELYTSQEWRRFRRDIAIRDNGCEFALPGFDIFKYATVHHLNPLTKQQIISRSPCVFDPNNAVLVETKTHKFLHYGHGKVPQKEPIVRRPNDTCPWK